MPRRGRPSGLDGFLAGYRFAFIAVGRRPAGGAGAFAAVPRAWSRRMRPFAIRLVRWRWWRRRAVRAAGRLQQRRRLRLELRFVRQRSAWTTTSRQRAEGPGDHFARVWTLATGRSSCRGGDRHRLAFAAWRLRGMAVPAAAFNAAKHVCRDRRRARLPAVVHRLHGDGGEWFLMWQSKDGTARAGLPLLHDAAAVGIFVSQPDGDVTSA